MAIQFTRSVRLFLAALAGAGLVACTAAGGPGQHARHHGAEAGHSQAQTASGAPMPHGGMGHGAMTGSGAGCAMMDDAAGSGCGMQAADKDAMCALQRSLRDAPSEQARQEIIERHMQGMSPAMRQRHMEMMRQHCQ